jgi:hypothetical protein
MWPATSPSWPPSSCSGTSTVAEERKLFGVKAAREQLLWEDPEFGRKARIELDRLADHLASRWLEHVARGRS